MVLLSAQGKCMTLSGDSISIFACSYGAMHLTFHVLSASPAVVVHDADCRIDACRGLRERDGGDSLPPLV